MYEPPAGVVGSSGKEGEEGCARWLGFRQGGSRVRGTNGLSLALKQGNVTTLQRGIFANVATFGATSRRSRE